MAAANTLRYTLKRPLLIPEEAGSTQEHALLRRAHIALQLEFKVAHETSWLAEGELQSLRAKLVARDAEVYV